MTAIEHSMSLQSMMLALLQMLLFIFNTQPIYSKAASCFEDPSIAYTITHDNCQSCSGNCGNVQTPISDRKSTCSCDHLCMTYGDCCPDFTTSCPELQSKAMTIMQKYGHPMKTLCMETLLVNECETDMDACQIGSDISNRIPARDLRTGVDFVNARCAICNGVQEGQLWSLSIECEEEVPELQLSGHLAAVNISSEKVHEILYDEDNYCFLNYLKPDKSLQKQRECVGIDFESCYHTCGNEEWMNGCANGSMQVLFDPQTLCHYKNKYCALCSMDTEAFSGLRCGHGCASLDYGRPILDYSFTLLFTFDTSAKNGVSRKCPRGETYINMHIGCKRISAAVMAINTPVTSNDSCCVFSIAIKEQFTIFPEFIIKEYKFNAIPYTLDKFSEKFCSYVKQKLQNIKTRHELQFNCTAAERSLKRLTFADVIAIQIQTEFTINSKDSSREIKTRTSLGDIAHMINNRNAFHIRPPLAFKTINITEGASSIAASCSYLSLPDNEYSFNVTNSDVTILSSQQVISREHYVIYGLILYLCTDEILSDTPETSKRGKHYTVLAIITIIFMSLSAIFLLFRLILQCIVPFFHSFPMKLQFHLSLVLFVSVCLFLIAPLCRDIKVLCKTVAIAMHYGFLSSFLWITALAMDMFIRLGSFECMLKTSKDSGFKQMRKHYVVGFVIPAIFVSIGIIFDYGDFVADKFRPRYGEDRCWISPNGHGIPMFFGIPVVLTILTNAALFVLLSIKLHKAFEKHNKLLRETKTNFWKYVKLFIILGVGNILLILMYFIDHISLKIIIVLIKTTEGIYVTTIYVFNKSVISYLLGKSNETENVPTKDTKNTQASSSEGKHDKSSVANGKATGRNLVSSSSESNASGLVNNLCAANSMVKIVEFVTISEELTTVENNTNSYVRICREPESTHCPEVFSNADNSPIYMNTNCPEVFSNADNSPVYMNTNVIWLHNENNTSPVLTYNNANCAPVHNELSLASVHNETPGRTITRTQILSSFESIYPPNASTVEGVNEQLSCDLPTQEQEIEQQNEQQCEQGTEQADQQETKKENAQQKGQEDEQGTEYETEQQNEQKDEQQNEQEYHRETEQQNEQENEQETEEENGQKNGQEDEQQNHHEDEQHNHHKDVQQNQHEDEQQNDKDKQDTEQEDEEDGDQKTEQEGKLENEQEDGQVDGEENEQEDGENTEQEDEQDSGQEEEQEDEEEDEQGDEQKTEQEDKEEDEQGDKQVTEQENEQ